MEMLKERLWIRAIFGLVICLGFIALGILSIVYEQTIFFSAMLFIVGVALAFYAYLGIANLFTVISKENNTKETYKLDLKDYYTDKANKNIKRVALYNKIIFYSLCISPFVIAIGILLGVFVVDSLFLALVLPSVVVTYLIVIFFIKEIASSINYEEAEKENEEVCLTNKYIFYKNKVYLINSFGFKIIDDKYKMFGITISTLDFPLDIKNKLMVDNNEICDK